MTDPLKAAFASILPALLQIEQAFWDEWNAREEPGSLYRPREHGCCWLTTISVEGLSDGVLLDSVIRDVRRMARQAGINCGSAEEPILVFRRSGEHWLDIVVEIEAPEKPALYSHRDKRIGEQGQ